MPTEAPTEVPTEAPTAIVQGGVHAEVVADLKKKLRACGYTPEDPKFYVVFFCNWQGEWDGAPFGLDFKTSKMSDFDGTNIHPVELHDPTLLEPWNLAHLTDFYAVCYLAKQARARGLRLVLACTLGENRSRAVQWALDPKDAHLPTCVAMRRAAEGYRNARDKRIVPLGPPRLRRATTAAATAAATAGGKAAKTAKAAKATA